MIVKGLDGKEYKLKLNTKVKDKCSKPHLRARELLNEIFPYDIVYEEVTLRGSKVYNTKDLYADFLIPAHNLLVEVHGEQHYKKTFFHNSKLEFIQAKARDARKREWCEINNICYVELPSGEKDEEWRARISGRFET